MKTFTINQRELDEIKNHLCFRGRTFISKYVQPKLEGKDKIVVTKKMWNKLASDLKYFIKHEYDTPEAYDSTYYKFDFAYASDYIIYAKNRELYYRSECFSKNLTYSGMFDKIIKILN